MKNESKFLIAASLGLLSVTSTAFAVEEVKAAPALSSVLEASGITATGYVAASYYTQDANTFSHQFDYKHESFQLDQAALTLAYTPDSGFGALVNVVAGEDARLINGASSGDTNSLAVTQAFVQYKGGPVTLMAGKMLTLAGAEVIAVSGNTNYSRSLLFFNEPLLHTGVRASVAAGDMFTFTGGINNGWNYDSSHTSSKTAEIGVGFTPSKQFSILGAYYTGQEPDAYNVLPTGRGKRTLLDLVATVTPTDWMSFVVSYDNGKQDSDANLVPSLKWDGIAAYANFTFNEQFRLSLRGEAMKFKQAGAEDLKLNEFTVTFGYSPVKSFELRAEVRSDMSNKIAGQGFFEKFSDGSATDSGTELALQGVFKF